VKSCRFWSGKSTNGNRRNNKCRCPIWVDGQLAGKRVNRSIFLQTGFGQVPRLGFGVKRAACVANQDTWCYSRTSTGLRTAKCFHLAYMEFCAERGLQFTNQIGLPALSAFRAQWKDGALSAGKKLERLRAVGRFFLDLGWWIENVALKLRRPNVKDAPTMPFTHEEITRLLAACEQYTDGHGNTSRENARRLRAFVLFVRYSALRISDAASCAVDRLSGNRLFLYTQKTGVPVYVPLPPFVVQALEACPRISERHWFWTGVGSKETLAGNWRRTFRRLCKIAGVQRGHAHRVRDTLAVELLLDGVPIERVSALLGHSSVNGVVPKTETTS
jgi:integrase/recombinase XerD